MDFGMHHHDEYFEELKMQSLGYLSRYLRGTSLQQIGISQKLVNRLSWICAHDFALSSTDYVTKMLSINRFGLLIIQFIEKSISQRVPVGNHRNGHDLKTSSSKKSSIRKQKNYEADLFTSGITDDSCSKPRQARKITKTIYIFFASPPVFLISIFTILFTTVIIFWIKHFDNLYWIKEEPPKMRKYEKQMQNGLYFYVFWSSWKWNKIQFMIVE